MSSESDRERLEFEREKWQAELASRREELGLKRIEVERSRWVNPLVIAVFAAAIAGLGNAAVTLMNGIQQTRLEKERATLTQNLNSEQSNATLRLEQSKSEAARILEVVKTNDPDKAAANLSFLIDTGLIADANVRSQIQAYLEKRKPGQGVSLPSPQAPPLDELRSSTQSFDSLMERPSREFMAAGGENDKVPAVSLMPELFIAALSGAADFRKRGFVSGAEIADYIRSQVFSLTTGEMIPLWGRLRDVRFAQGEFLFRVIDPSTSKQSEPAANDPLRHGHALLIGNAHYSSWPELHDVQNQIAKLALVLRNHFDTVDVVQDLKAEDLRQTLDKFLRTHGNDINGRLFIYYSGHSYTETISQWNETRSYIIGIDTPLLDGTPHAFDAARQKAISIPEMRRFVEESLSRHIFVVFDAAVRASVFQSR